MNFQNNFIDFLLSTDLKDLTSFVWIYSYLEFVQKKLSELRHAEFFLTI